ncbi:MAG: hypothetical protein R3B13_20410 [Polyangiaceae bacterium]
MQTVLAKCENCGGALRIATGANSAECVYCGATSFVQSSAAQGDAPKLRVDPPPPVDGDFLGLYFMIVSLGLLSAGMLLYGVFAEGTDRIVTLGVGVFFGVFAMAFVLGLLQARSRYRDEVWFRENALPGRATVREIAVAHDGMARLSLEVQVAGQAPRHLEHVTGIPALLVPRLTQGLSLPIAVHPHDGSRLEIQWHLV